MPRSSVSRLALACSILLAPLLAACAPPRPEVFAAASSPDRSARALLYSSATIPSLGSAQGVITHRGLLYAFGDADTGIIRELAPAPSHLRGRASAYLPTGRDIRLTRAGVNLSPHPTGLALRDGLPTFLGDTVKRRGTILLLDWPRALADANLDNAVLNTIDDDAAINGTRPVYVRWRDPATSRDRWVIATSDYGATGNEIRLYDPERLASVQRTSDPGVVLARIPCGPWVQALHWIDDRRTLVIVQNQIEGLRWRLTFARLDFATDLRGAPSIDIPLPGDELEGMTTLDSSADHAALAVFLTSSPRDNLWIGELMFAGPAHTAPPPR